MTHSENLCTRVSFRQMILEVDKVAGHVVGFGGKDGYLFVASVCRAWRLAWGSNACTTDPMTDSTTVSQLTEALESGVPRQDLCARACSLGRLDMVRATREMGCPWGNSLALVAFHRDLDFVRIVREMGCPMTANTFEVASFVGDIDTMSYLRQNGCPQGECVLYACQAENIRSLEWLKNNGSPLLADDFSSACSTGNIEVVDWFRINNSAYDEDAAVCAVLSGNIHLVYLLWRNGYPFLENEVVNKAASLESKDMLVWLVTELGFSMSELACIEASKRGRLDTLVWAREAGFVWGEKVCIEAKRNGHVDVVIWCRQNGL